VERVFDAEEQVDHTVLERPVADGWIMLQRSPSAASSSESSAYLEDPMHSAQGCLSSGSTCATASSSRSINSIALDILDVGDVTVDEEGAEWVVRRCWCNSAECPGKAFKRVEGKDELDAWDKGRPLPR